MSSITTYTTLDKATGMTSLDYAWLTCLARRDSDREKRIFEFGGNVLHECVKEHSPHMLMKLLALGYNVDSKDKFGQTPLFYAINFGIIGNCNILLESGANPDHSDINGNTPLIAAIAKNNKEIVQLLVESGADVNKRNKWGETPLFVAYAEKRKDVYRYLIDMGAVSDYERGDK